MAFKKKPTKKTAKKPAEKPSEKPVASKPLRYAEEAKPAMEERTKAAVAAVKKNMPREAIQFTGKNAEDCMKFCGVSWRRDLEGRAIKLKPPKSPPQETLHVKEGEYIVRKTVAVYEVVDEKEIERIQKIIGH